MSQFDKPPQAAQPKYTAEKLAEYLRETDGALAVSLKVLVRGFEVSANPETYEPWPKAEIKKALDSILSLCETKVKYYEGAGEMQKAQEARDKVESLRKIFSEIDIAEEVPEAFLQKVQQSVED